VYLNKPVIDPLGEALSEYQLMCEITKRIAREVYNEICLDPFEILRIAFGDEILKKLIEQGCVVLEPKPKDDYQTPTGRIELYSTQAVKEGLPPLPTPPGEEIDEDKFIFITSAHIKYIHTQFEEVYGGVPAELHISPEDAEKLGILDGDIVEVFNERASFIARAVIDKGLQRGVLWMPRHARGLNGFRVSALMSDDVDAYSGAVLNSTRVRVRKLGRVT
jgi:anaerobic selenocysteine-containing dehydrogenase